MKYILGQCLYLHLFLLLYKRGTLLPLLDQCMLRNCLPKTKIANIIKGPLQDCITVNFIGIMDWDMQAGNSTILY